MLGPETEIRLAGTLDDIRLQELDSDDTSKPEFINPLLNPLGVEFVSLPPADTSCDPLTDDLYFRAHRRLERQEKQLRNIERARAQHEKIQLDRLLSDLQGPEWLRVLGINGVTDNERRLYKPKRDIFVREIEGLLGKFRWWKEEEKSRRAEKEKERELGRRVENDCGSLEQEMEVDGLSRQGDCTGLVMPNGSDVDALAARQLHQEAMSATLLERARGSIQNNVKANASTHLRRPVKSKPNSTSKLKSSRTSNAADRDILPSPLSLSPSSPPSNHHRAHGRSHPRSETDPVHRTTTTTHSWRRRRSPALTSNSQPEQPNSQPAPLPPRFTSFYAKRSERDAAVQPRRRRPRFRTAFGLPLPDIPVQEFLLPSEIFEGGEMNGEGAEAAEPGRSVKKR